MKSVAPTRQRWAQVGAASLALLLALTACGSGPNETGPSEAGEPGASAASADRTAILKTPIANQIKFLDPIRLGDPAESNILASVYDTLLRRDADGVLQPRLATGWEQVDESTLRVELQEGVKFQDGTDFNADAVVFSIERALTSDLSSLKSMLYMLDGVEAIDDLTVEFALDPELPAFGPLLDSFTGRVGMITSPAAVEAGGDDFISEGAGAGLYAVESFTPGSDARVRAWDGYWNPDQQLLAGIDFVASSGDNTPLMLSGNVDLVFPTANALEPYTVDPNLVIMTRPGIEYYIVGLNETLPPFDDVRVRQAVAYAVDRELITETFGFGVATTAFQALPPQAIGHDEALNENFHFDPEKAKELLAEAGYPNGGVAVHFAIGQQAAVAVRTLEVIQQMLEDVGFDVRIELVDLATIPGKMYGDRTIGDCGTVNGGYFLVKLQSADPDNLFRSRYLEESPLNPGCNEPAWLRPLVDSGAIEADEDVRAEIYSEISARAQEEVLDGVYLYYNPAITVLQPYVGGWDVAYTSYTADWHGLYITDGRVPVERG